MRGKNASIMDSFEALEDPRIERCRGQGGMCICRALGIGPRVSQECFGPRLQHRPAAPIHLASPGWPARRGSYRPFPAPMPWSPGTGSRRIIGIEAWTVVRQIHQPQPQPRRPQVLPHRLATVRRGVVPDHVQWTKAPLPNLHQQGLEVVPAALPLLLAVQSQPKGQGEEGMKLLKAVVDPLGVRRIHHPNHPPTSGQLSYQISRRFSTACSA